MKTKTNVLTILLIFFLGGLTKIIAQNYIMALSSATNNKKMYLLNPTDGSIVNSNFIDFAPRSAGTIKASVQVGERIWITDQTGDRIYIYDLSGNYVSTLSTGLDNIRGINIVNNEVWVSNDGSANGATADSIVRYSTTGTFLGLYSSNNTSLFDIVDNGNGIVYVSGLTNQGIEKINYSGLSLGYLVGSGIFQNLQQINLTRSGNLLVAVFQSNVTSGNEAGVYLLSTVDGSIINRWPVSGLRGVIELEDGSILFTNDTALSKINPTNGTITSIENGSFQYLAKVNLSNLNINTQEKTSLKLYPNPTADYVELVSDSTIDTINIIDINGKIVLSKQVNLNTYSLDVRQLSAGVYIIQLASKNKISQHKFIKK